MHSLLFGDCACRRQESPLAPLAPLPFLSSSSVSLAGPLLSCLTVASPSAPCPTPSHSRCSTSLVSQFRRFSPVLSLPPPSSPSSPLQLAACATVPAAPLPAHDPIEDETPAQVATARPTTSYKSAVSPSWQHSPNRWFSPRCTIMRPKDCALGCIGGCPPCRLRCYAVFFSSRRPKFRLAFWCVPPFLQPQALSPLFPPRSVTSRLAAYKTEPKHTSAFTRQPAPSSLASGKRFQLCAAVPVPSRCVACSSRARPSSFAASNQHFLSVLFLSARRTRPFEHKSTTTFLPRLPTG